MLRFLSVLALCLLSSVSLAATLFLSEFVGPPYVSVYYQAVPMPALANQTVAVGGGSLQSTAFSATTNIIRVHVDVASCVLIGGTNPTATTSSMRMGAGQTEYFIVRPGDKLAVIAAP